MKIDVETAAASLRINATQGRFALGDRKWIYRLKVGEGGVDVERLDCTGQAGHHASSSSRAAPLHRTALRLGRLGPIWQPKMMTSRLLCKLWAHRGAPSPRNSSSGNLVKQILTGMTPKPDWSRSSSQSCLKCPPRKASRPSPFFPSHRCAVLVWFASTMHMHLV